MGDDIPHFVAFLAMALLTPWLVRALRWHWHGQEIQVLRDYVNQFWPFPRFVNRRLVPIVHIFAGFFWSVSLLYWGDRLREQLGPLGMALEIVGAATSIILLVILVTLGAFRWPSPLLPPWARRESVEPPSEPG